MDWAYGVGLDPISPGNKTQRCVICGNRKGKERIVAEVSFWFVHNSQLPTPAAQTFQSQVIWRLPCTESCDFSTDLSSFAMADEEPVDQKKYLEESCKPKCVKPFLEYQACVKRIQDDDSGHKHCTGQYFDFWSCIDKCVAPKLFPKLK